jgi:hypothetical protein
MTLVLAAGVMSSWTYVVTLGCSSSMAEHLVTNQGNSLAPLVLAACQKLGQGDCVRSLHERSKSARVGERQGRTKAFLNFLCIWTDKEQVLFIFYLPQVTALTKPLNIWHTFPRT